MTVGGEPVAIHSSGQTTFSLAHIEGITLGAGEDVNEVAGGASSMVVQFYVRVFPFLSLILCYSYFGTFLSTWSVSCYYSTFL